MSRTVCPGQVMPRDPATTPAPCRAKPCHGTPCRSGRGSRYGKNRWKKKIKKKKGNKKSHKGMGSLLYPHPISCRTFAPVTSSGERGSPLPSGSNPCQNQLLLARGEVRELRLCHVCLQKVPTWHRHRVGRRPSPCSPSSPVGRGQPGSCSCWKRSLPRTPAGS